MSNIFDSESNLSSLESKFINFLSLREVIVVADLLDKMSIGLLLRGVDVASLNMLSSGIFLSLVSLFE
mgnify:CR=1 FL=1